MNEDRGTHGEDATQAGPGEQPERGLAGIPGRAGPDDDRGTADGQAPAGPPGTWAARQAPGNGQSATGNGQYGGPGGQGTPADPGPGGAAADVDGAAEPGSAARPQARRAQRKRRKSRSWWIELPVLLFCALVLALLIKTFVVQAFFIPSSSMEDTLKIGDKVLVNKLVYDFRPIHRGDIVVFNGDGSWNAVPMKPKPALVRLWDSVAGLFGSPPGAHDYIKRVIGIPGDHVACCNPQHLITVNGVPLHEQSYLFPGNAPSNTHFNITVPPGRLWVMGDHRAVSADSRYHMNDPGGGSIPEDQVVGRAFLIIAPISRWRFLPIPSTFEQPKLSAAGTAAGMLAGMTPAAAAKAGPGLMASAAGLAGEPGGPLLFGLIGAFPLTWMQRRARRRLAGLARRRPAARRRARGPGCVRPGSGRPGSGRPGSGRPGGERSRGERSGRGLG